MPLTRTGLTCCLDRIGHAVAVLDLGDGLSLIATAAGGRLFGPYLAEEDLLGWMPDLHEFEAALAARHWNIGGDRVWLAPERAFNFADPAAMLESYRVDPVLDPGCWRMTEDGRGLTLQSAMVLPRSDGGLPVSVTLTRRIWPLAQAAPPRAGLWRGSYRQTVTATCGPKPDGLAVVPWLIRQVDLGGTARLSASRGHIGNAVFGQAPRAALIPVDGFWQVPIGPTGFFKTSYARADVGQDGLSYSVVGSQATTLLTLRPHLADAAHYTETLPQDPAGPGQAAALFCDDGTFGAYGELELYGHRSGPDTGAMIVDVHILHGEADAVAAAQSVQATEISSIPIS